MPNTKFHFYDIECLRNIFTLTVYLPEENKVEQYFLTSRNAHGEKQSLFDLVHNEPNLLDNTTQRVRLRNLNFNPGRKINRGKNNRAILSMGSVELYDLSNNKNVIRLAKEFGMSNADDASDPYDNSSIYPMAFRLSATTDLPVKNNSHWTPEHINQNMNKRLFNQENIKELKQYTPVELRNKTFTKLAQTHYQYFDDTKMPYLIGYNSYNYDLTLLAIFLAGAFTEVNKNSVDFRKNIFSLNCSGVHYFNIQPDSPESLRNVNDAMFSSRFIDSMPSILYQGSSANIPGSYDVDYHNANKIRKNMLRSGRHLDAARLNEKMNKVGLKRLLGTLGYQILESDKLRPGTDTIQNLDQFYDLLAYNASDCINLAALFSDDQYIGTFNLKKQLLHDYPMTVYSKADKAYEPVIDPSHVKPNRMQIDSSSAQIATNVICPYGHLNDIIAVDFTYPEKRKSIETGIAQFNVLDLTRQFFYERVYQPALKLNPKAAKKAMKSFENIMTYYQFVQGKNFNDSAHYYQKYLLPYNPNRSAQDYLKNLDTDGFKALWQTVDSFNWVKVGHALKTAKDEDLFTFTEPNTQIKLNIPYGFLKHQKIAYATDDTNSKAFIPLTINDLISHLNRNEKPNTKTNQYRTYSLMQLIGKFEKDNISDLTDIQTEDKATEKKRISYQSFDKIRTAVRLISKKYLGVEFTLSEYNPKKRLSDQQLVNAETHRKVSKVIMRPYTADDMPAGNYSMPFFNKDATPSAGYIHFSLGGIHGAEYDLDLYIKDHKDFNRRHNMMPALNGKPAPYTDAERKWLTQHELFRPDKKGDYDLNKRYVYTSIDPVNHEDFHSYYPGMCRMLNVYWNDGIGYDIYGKIYDRKQELGNMMKDPKYTPEERAYFKSQRGGTKLILNSTTGKGDSHGQNSPIQMNNNIISMRLIGQMFTWRIGQAQTTLGAKCISTNTDGIYSVMDDVELNDKSLAHESAQIHVGIDPERLFLISKDANNRIEADIKTHALSSASGGGLRAFNGPTTSGRLSHPAAIDRALGLYLLNIADKNSKYYDPELKNDFNLNLSSYILHHLLKPDVDNKDLTLPEKQKLLNYFQNMIASSPGSSRYIFTTKKYIPVKTLNDSKFVSNTQANNPVYGQLFNLDSITQNDLTNVQQFNRVFYVKDNGFTHDQIVHVYVASGRKVPAKDIISRKRNGQAPVTNSEPAEYILRQNGVNIGDLNSEDREASIVNLPSLPASQNVIIVNNDLSSLNEDEVDNILNSLDYRFYLELFCKTYVKNWSNSLFKKDNKNSKLDTYLEKYVSMAPNC